MDCRTDLTPMGAVLRVGQTRYGYRTPQHLCGLKSGHRTPADMHENQNGCRPTRLGHSTRWHVPGVGASYIRQGDNIPEQAQHPRMQTHPEENCGHYPAGENKSQGWGQARLVKVETPIKIHTYNTIINDLMLEFKDYKVFLKIIQDQHCGTADKSTISDPATHISASSCPGSTTFNLGSW